MYFCPKCSYSFDVTKLSSNTNDDKEEISSLNTIVKKINKNENIQNIKLTIPKNSLLNDDKFKKLKENIRKKILSLYDNKASNIIFHCLNCNNKSSINETIRLYNLDLREESGNILSFDDCKIISNDPILPRTKDFNCKNINCITHKDKSKKEAVYYKDNSTYKVNYICCSCYTNWSLN